MNTVYKVSYQLRKKTTPSSTHETNHPCEKTILAEDAEDAIKRVRKASKYPVVTVGSVVFIATFDLCPNAPLAETCDENERLRDIIRRASTKFFAGGSDGAIAVNMFTILGEASKPNAPL